MPESKIANFVLLPELKINHFGADGISLCEKVSEFEVCPKCAVACSSVYDYRWVQIRDEPLRGDHITLRILAFLLQRLPEALYCQSPE